ncbi:MAG TPA: aminotransferase class I/II-fold pyridoxal phosphate-dependent enzyme, partial [Polyangiaceae bacterium]|nr:aminotransferase class I/II-fold pyridoxal phosphate-dependent enzyme [Polyangiaceae bacterium]
MARNRTARRTQGFTESVIREMTRVCAEHDGVNLAQGYPDFPAPEEVKRAAVEAILGDVNQYSITWGAQSMRAAVAEHAERFYGMRVDPERQVTVCCGSTEAMLSTLLSLVDPGDEVIVLEPYYENYGPGAALCGARPVYVALEAPHFRIDPERLRAAFGPRTKAIVLNTPNNPTGRVFDRQELQAVADLCLEWDVVAITDEIYEHIVYDGRRHVPLATLDGMAERTVTISSCSKTFSVTGWRVGYAIASAERTDAIRKVHDFVTVGAPAPLQEAGAAALRLPDAYFEQLSVHYGERRARMIEALRSSGLEPVCVPEGAYYVLVDIGGFGWPDDDLFARELVRRVGVATVPGSSFFHEPSM